MAHFEDKSPPAEILTEWGAWSQTRDDITIEVHLPQVTASKDISVTFSSKRIRCSASGKIFFEGELFNFIHVDESTWSLEDGTVIRIFLSKAKGGETWPSILVCGQFAATPVNMEEMLRHSDLESFHAQEVVLDSSNNSSDIYPVNVNIPVSSVNSQVTSGDINRPGCSKDTNQEAPVEKPCGGRRRKNVLPKKAYIYCESPPQKTIRLTTDQSEEVPHVAVAEAPQNNQDMYKHFGDFVVNSLREVGYHTAKLMQGEISQIIFQHLTSTDLSVSNTGASDYSPDDTGTEERAESEEQEEEEEAEEEEEEEWELEHDPFAQ